MYGKIVIQNKTRILTGMHIGGSDAFSAIGAVDSPVIRDPMTGAPIIPGSSLKGKLRTLLIRSLSGGGLPPKPGDDPEVIRRLFGTGASEGAIRSRLQFADAFLTNADVLEAVGATEVKFENTINRVTARAMPRQIERVVRGAVFENRIVYELADEGEIETDLRTLAKGMQLLQIDYLGGHGTRGSGRISFTDIELRLFENTALAGTLEELKALFKDVEGYALLSV